MVLAVGLYPAHAAGQWTEGSGHEAALEVTGAGGTSQHPPVGGYSDETASLSCSEGIPATWAANVGTRRV